MKVDIITMGCAKNLVDSERLAHMMSDRGIDVAFDVEGFSGGPVVINTCGFIGDAKEESIEMILSALEAKAAGTVEAVYVMGCLSERYRRELPEEMPEVDGWYGKFDWDAVAERLGGSLPEPKSKAWERELSGPSHSAYIKIAEGCNRFCAFCAIPLITGRYRSRTPEDVLEEVRALAANGVREFNVIAQDLSYYGRDLPGGRSRLAGLIDNMADIPGAEMIRLHYAYPADFPFDVLEVMARRPNVCKYLDIALQHISDPVLRNMRRHIDREGTLRLLERIRREVPGIAIRTTLMVGFPGEGEKEFEELKEFVRSQRFERMGAFAYCEEDDTYAAKNFEDSIPEDVKQARLDEIMAIQEEIAAETSARMAAMGRHKVIIDSEGEDYYIGRTQYDSPEVDPEVLVEKTRKLEVGEIYDVEITGHSTFELYGRVI